MDGDVRKDNPGAFHVGMMKAPGADPMCTLQPRPAAGCVALYLTCLDRGICRLFGVVSVSVLCADCDPSQGAQLRHEQLHVLSGLHGRHRALRALWPVWRV